MYYVKYLDEKGFLKTVECDGTKTFAEGYAKRLAQVYGKASTYETCLRLMDTFTEVTDLPERG